MMRTGYPKALSWLLASTNHSGFTLYMRLFPGLKLILESQQNINDRLRFGSIDSGIFPLDQTWDPVDLVTLDAMTDLNDLDLQEGSTESEQTVVAPSKVVSTFPCP